MKDITIRSTPNGGFIVREAFDGDVIAALSNSGDLIRWVTSQFERPKNDAPMIMDNPRYVKITKGNTGSPDFLVGEIGLLLNIDKGANKFNVRSDGEFDVWVQEVEYSGGNKTTGPFPEPVVKPADFTTVENFF